MRKPDFLREEAKRPTGELPCCQSLNGVHKMSCSAGKSRAGRLTMPASRGACDSEFVALYTRSIVRRGSRAHQELLAAGWTEELPTAATSTTKGSP